MKLVCTLLVLALAVPALAGGHQGAMKTKSGWFDMEVCEFCKNMAKDPAFMDHVKFESQKIENGAILIMVVDPTYEVQWKQACTAMQALGDKMQSGKVDPTKVKMCGHCKAYGELMMAGVHMEEVDGKIAKVTLITSGDPQVIAKIHEFNRRNNEEMAELAAAHQR
jgi:hypothetical protein